MSQRKPKLLKKESFLAFVQNSVGSKAYRNIFVLDKNKQIDILENGNLSCAYFASSTLKIFGLITDIHATVDSTIADLKLLKYRSVKTPTSGDIIIWGANKTTNHHRHIGFFIGNAQAVSTSDKKRTVVVHRWDFAGKRPVEIILRNKL